MQGPVGGASSSPVVRAGSNEDWMSALVREDGKDPRRSPSCLQPWPGPASHPAKRVQHRGPTMATISHLWAIGYDDMARADEVREVITELGWDQSFLILED